MEEHVPFNRHLGIKGEMVEPGRAVLVLPVRPEFVGDPRRPALHGGVLSTLIDTAGGVAGVFVFPPPGTVSPPALPPRLLYPPGPPRPPRPPPPRPCDGQPGYARATPAP